MKVLVSLVLLMLATRSSAAPDAWSRAESEIRRLPPTAFRELPRAVAGYLVRRGCTIPQAWGRNQPHNVIRGKFLQRGAKDWAVLCSRDGTSTILLFRKGLATPAAELNPGKDINWLQTVTGDGQIGYSRIISPATRREILYYRKAFGGPLPSPLDHEGIEDYLEGKASIIHYAQKGEWLELTGMD